MIDPIERQRRTRQFRELDRQHWEQLWERLRLPLSIRPGAIPDEHALLRRHLPSGRGGMRLIEVGCAPGRFLDYFARHFGYQVTGLDYAPEACRTTRANLAMLGTPATILGGDLFTFRPADGGFDVVLSVGLIEHFTNVDEVVRKLIGMADPDGGCIVTLVPNLYGLEGLVLRAFRPRVYDGHLRISRRELIRLHERSGTETLFADYVGGISVPLLVRGTGFPRRHPRIALAVNSPIGVLNRIVKKIEVVLGRFPRNVLFSPSLMYIGRRAEGSVRRGLPAGGATPRGRGTRPPSLIRRAPAA